MAQSTSATPSQKVVCESNDCGKEYVSKGVMKAHFKRCHKAAEDVQSPLGKFPSANSARVLFTDETQPSTQGNSAGQVNSPKVVSVGRFICDICDKDFDTSQHMNNHKQESHDQVNAELSNVVENSGNVNNSEEDGVGQCKCDICDKDFETSQHMNNHKKESHDQENLEQSEALQNALVAEELEDMVRKVRNIFQGDCHDCDMKEQVVNHKEELLVKKDADIQILEQRVKKTDEKVKQAKDNRPRKAIKKTFLDLQDAGAMKIIKRKKPLSAQEIEESNTEETD
jgi:hypothetical protein